MRWTHRLHLIGDRKEPCNCDDSPTGKHTPLDHVRTFMYEKILLPTDGTESIDSAVEHALNLAQTYDSELHVLYVVDESAYGGVDIRTELIREGLENEGTRAVDTVRKRADEAGISVVGEVTTGRPYRKILSYADRNDIDLIVMGTHGRRGVDRYLLGSVAEKVVRSADVPVMSVHRSSNEST